MAFERHARTVSLLTLVSRVTGVARDAVLSRVFGAGGLTDAFFFAFLIPNLFRRLFGEGALAAAFLPTYTDLEERDPEAARRLASAVVAALAGGLAILVVIGEVVLFIADRAGGTSLALRLTMVMLPYMPLVCVLAILGAMLQVHGRFGPAAAAPIILNLCIIGAAIGGGWWFATPNDADGNRILHIGAVAASVVVAGVLQVAWALYALRGRGWWTRARDGVGDGARRILRMAGPMILGLGVLQLNTLFDGVIANYRQLIGPTIFGVDYPLQTGAMSAISYAQRLYQFPLGVFGIAVATAIYPALARTVKDSESFMRTLRRGMRLVVYIGLPASIGLILVRLPLATVILQGGAFTASDAERVSHVLLGYAPAVWAYSMTHVLTRAFYAREDTRTPVRVAMAIVGLNLALNCTLIWTPLRESGLAWSTALCAVLQTAILQVLLRRRLGHDLTTTRVHLSWLKSVIGAGAMAVCVLVIQGMLGPAATWRAALVALAVLVGVGGVVYVMVTLALRMPELRWSLGFTDEEPA